MSGVGPASWWGRARCRERGLERWFADDGGRAKAFCAGCSVRVECLVYGMAEEHGVWGGLTVKKRRTLRRLQAQLAAGPVDASFGQDLVRLILAGADEAQLAAVLGLDGGEVAVLLERGRAGMLAGHAAGTVQLSLPERVRMEDPSVDHGHLETYRAGCRCEPCREANSDSYVAKRPHKQRQPAA